MFNKTLSKETQEIKPTLIPIINLLYIKLLLIALPNQKLWKKVCFMFTFKKRTLI